jgi:hypothetical protein
MPNERANARLQWRPGAEFMVSEQHALLVTLAERWLKRNGFGVVATEIRAAGTREEADAIGFRSTCTAIIEAKVSRSDFLADLKKPERVSGRGLGVYRFYLTPSGLIVPDELPPGWGLLYEERGRVIDIVRPQGNLWCEYALDREVEPGWRKFQNVPNVEAERQVLYSIARRQQELIMQKLTEPAC